MTDSEYFRKFIVANAQRWVGEKEIRGNSGFVSKELDILARNAGFQNGYAWCSIFCEVVYKLALDDLEKHTGKVFKTLRSVVIGMINPSSQLTYNNALSTVFFKQTQTPRAGDIVIFVRTSNRAYGHAGIVTSVTADGFWTVEGNTNDSGSTEGDGVYKKFRKIEKDGRGLDVRGFISVIDF